MQEAGNIKIRVNFASYSSSSSVQRQIKHQTLVISLSRQESERRICLLNVSNLVTSHKRCPHLSANTDFLPCLMSSNGSYS